MEKKELLKKLSTIKEQKELVAILCIDGAGHFPIDIQSAYVDLLEETIHALSLACAETPKSRVVKKFNCSCKAVIDIIPFSDENGIIKNYKVLSTEKLVEGNIYYRK